jgi:arylformamidase
LSDVFDISPLISERIGVFPGDVKFSRNISMDFDKGDHFALSSLTTTVHLGAHTDAPNHYRKNLKGIEARSLSLYMGKAQVIRADVKRGELISSQHIKGKKITAPRVLFYTGSFPNSDEWNSDFAALSPDLIHELHKQGVRLIGIDTPSIDPENSKTLDAHQAVADHDMAILEGIVLDMVPEGLFTLIALPLRIENADASPVRAVLLKNLEYLQN